MQLNNSLIMIAPLMVTLLATGGCNQREVIPMAAQAECSTNGTCVQNFIKREEIRVNGLSSRPARFRVTKWVSIHYNYNSALDQEVVDRDFTSAGWLRTTTQPTLSEPAMICRVAFAQREGNRSNVTACSSPRGSITLGQSTLDQSRVIDQVTAFENVHDLLEIK